MPSRGQTITITFTAWDNVANEGKTGDAANFTLRWVKDGTSAVPTNAPATEIDSANCPGLYKIVLTGTECTCDFGALGGKSSTSGVSIIPTCVAFEQLPIVDPGTTGGVLIAGSADVNIISVNGTTFVGDSIPAVLAGGVAHGDSTATLTLQTMAVANPVGHAVYLSGDNGGSGLFLSGGATGNGITIQGGSIAGWPIYLTHTNTPDGSDVFGQLGPNVLDLVHLVAPTGVATEFVEAMTQLYHRYFPPGPGGEVFKTTSDHTIRTRDSSGTVITTQPYTDDGAGNESVGPAS